MPAPSPQALADAVLLLHFAIVLFVLLGPPAVIAGNRLGWSWVNRWDLRAAHLLAIAVVVVQAWLGQHCGLTVLESWLRQQAGQAGYRQSFVEHWVQRVLYHQAPGWVFTAAYTAFAGLVLWCWWRYPPRRARAHLG